MIDDDRRIEKRRLVAELSYWAVYEGPIERARCGEHRLHWEAWRWRWRVPLGEQDRLEAHAEGLLDAHTVHVCVCPVCRDDDDQPR